MQEVRPLPHHLKVRFKDMRRQPLPSAPQNTGISTCFPQVTMRGKDINVSHVREGGGTTLGQRIDKEANPYMRCDPPPAPYLLY